MAEPPAFLGYYPVGAFVISSRRALNPFVARLRQLGRLRGGVNVTTFDPDCCRLLPDDIPGDSSSTSGRGDCRLQSAELHQPLSHAYLQVVEAVDPATGAPVPGLVTRHRVTYATAGPTPPRDAQAEGGTRCAGETPSWLHALSGLGRGSDAPGQESKAVATDTTLFAVHATGAWTLAELRAVLAPEEVCTPSACTGDAGPAIGSSGTALAYVHQLRVYSAPCLPHGFTEDTENSLPSASRPGAAAFRALHRLAVEQHFTTTTPSAPPHRGCEAVHRTSSEQGGFSFSELFAGMGMFRVGLERAGGRACFAVEYALPARVVYDHSFRDADTVPLAADITELPSHCFPQHDLLTAGFPCQSFAKAGPATGLHSSRGWLFYEVVRVLAASRPRAFLLENVANLVHVEAGEQLGEISRRLRAPLGAEEERWGSGPPLRYAVGYRVLDGALLTPQSRQRVYFVGVRVDPGGAEHDMNKLVEDILCAAEARAKSVGATQPYRCVHDVLEPTCGPKRGARMGSSSAPDSSHSTDPDGVSGGRTPSSSTTITGTQGPATSALALTPTQWEAVQRSRTYRQNPLWRLANVRGHARTLMGSYRTSYQLYSEFLPYPDQHLALTQEAFLDVLVRAQSPSPQRAGREGGMETDSTSGRVSGSRGGDGGADGTPPAPPLRFYSVRECARLQGIPDSYPFPLALEDDGRGGTSGTDVLPERVGGGRALPIGALYKLIGNAVNPLMIECLGRSIAERLFAGE